MNVVAVLIGGLIGTGLRVGLDLALPHGSGQFPWSTFVVNIAGSLALGLLVARVWPVAPAWLRFGLGTGMLGSFTTFSALAASVVTLTAGGDPLLALVYLVASLFVGIGAAVAGLRIGAHPPASEAQIGPDE
ncbi:MAG TPA: CrcB family protein [Pseudolysinimonas sp.]|nr:CrcB family protein [Pseudolysinimonas sp.]